MLFKRGSTISAAEGGCQAEVGGMTPRLVFPEDAASDAMYLTSGMFNGQRRIRCVHGRYVTSHLLSGDRLSQIYSRPGDRTPSGFYHSH